jgi:hypothetical protein
MKKFIVNLILFCTVIISILYLLDYVVTKGLRKSHFHTFNNLTKIYNNELNCDLLINGSSIAKFQVSPRIIDSVLDVDSYNFGMEGVGFLPQKMQYDFYLTHNEKPKIILQLLGDFAMFKRDELIGYNEFAPYLDNDMVKNLTKKYQGFTFLDYNIPFIRYTGRPFDIIDGIFCFAGIELRKPSGYKGYFEQNKSWDDEFEKFKEKHKNGLFIKMDKETMEAFENYVAECKSNKIDLFLIYPPTFYEFKKYVKNENNIISFYKNIANKYQVPFLDYSQNSIIYKQEYFYDSQHLNKKGEELFTHILAEDIKKLMLDF